MRHPNLYRRQLAISTVTALLLAALLLGACTPTQASPDDDLANRVQLVVSEGISVTASDGTVFLVGSFSGDLAALVSEIRSIDGVVQVVTDGIESVSTPTTQDSQLSLGLGEPSFHLTVIGDSVEISGTLPNTQIADQVLTAVSGVFGSRRVESRLEAGLVDDAPWISSLATVMDAILNVQVRDFEFDITMGKATLKGTAQNQESVDDLVADLSLVLGFEPVSFIDIRDLSAELTALLRGTTTFETGSAELSEEGKTVLDEAASLLIETSDGLMRVVGHTDSVGDRRANQILSEERAQAVVDYLVSKGVAAEQLRAVGFGDTRPIASNDTEEGRAQNRRIEFVVGG